MVQFIKDLKRMTLLGDEKLNDFISLLNNTNPSMFASSIKIDKFFEENGIAQDDGRKIRRFITFVAESMVESTNAEAALADIEKNVIGPFQNDRDVILSWERMKGLLSKLEGFIINIKEKQLNERIDRVANFSLTCDVRPVFDLDKKKIVRYLYPVILRISSTENDDDLILQTDGDGLIKIKSEIDMALQKLSILQLNVNNE